MTTPGAPAEVSFLILTYSPFVYSVVAKNVTCSLVPEVSMVRGRSSVMVSSLSLLLSPVLVCSLPFSCRSLQEAQWIILKPRNSMHTLIGEALLRSRNTRARGTYSRVGILRERRV